MSFYTIRILSKTQDTDLQVLLLLCLSDFVAKYYF